MRTENHQILSSLLLLGSAVIIRSNSVTLTKKRTSSQGMRTVSMLPLVSNHPEE